MLQNKSSQSVSHFSRLQRSTGLWHCPLRNIPCLPDLPVLPFLPPSPDINTLIFPSASSLLISFWESTCPPNSYSCLGQFAFHYYSQACQHFWSSHCLPCRGKGLTQLCARVLPLKASGVGNQTHPQEALEVSFQRCEHLRGGNTSRWEKRRSQFLHSTLLVNLCLTGNDIFHTFHHEGTVISSTFQAFPVLHPPTHP